MYLGASQILLVYAGVRLPTWVQNAVHKHPKSLIVVPEWVTGLVEWLGTTAVCVCYCDESHLTVLADFPVMVFAIA